MPDAKESRQKKIRLMVYLRGYWPAFSGFAYHLRHRLRLLPRFGIEPRVLTDLHNGDKKSELVDDILVRRVPVPKMFSGRSSLFESFMLPWFIKFRDEYDLALIASSSVAGTFLKDFCRKPVVREGILNENHAAKFEQRVTGALRKLAFKRVDHIVAISPAVEKSYLNVSWPEERMHLIPRGVDHGLYRPPVTSHEKQKLRNELGLPDFPNKLFLTVGAIRERKGYFELIEAWRSIVSELQSAYLIIIGPVGDIAYHQELLKRIERYRLTDKVILKGRSERVPEFMRCADGFVFASSNEGFPNVVIEAMSSGLPIVAYNIDDILPFIIKTPESGRLVPRDDSVSFSANILEIAQDPTLRRKLGDSARQEVLSIFPLLKEAEEHAALYKNIVNGAM